MPPLLDHWASLVLKFLGFTPKLRRGWKKALQGEACLQGKSHQCFHYLKVCCKPINEAPAYFGLLVCQRNKAAVL